VETLHLGFFEDWDHCPNDEGCQKEVPAIRGEFSPRILPFLVRFCGENSGQAAFHAT
jgi:hypothetical protein